MIKKTVGDSYSNWMCLVLNQNFSLAPFSWMLEAIHILNCKNLNILESTTIICYFTAHQEIACKSKFKPYEKKCFIVFHSLLENPLTY